MTTPRTFDNAELAEQLHIVIRLAAERGEPTVPAIAEFLRRLREAERERCAVVAEGYRLHMDDARERAGYRKSVDIAAAIRALGEG